MSTPTIIILLIVSALFIIVSLIVLIKNKDTGAILGVLLGFMLAGLVLSWVKEKAIINKPIDTTEPADTSTVSTDSTYTNN